MTADPARDVSLLQLAQEYAAAADTGDVERFLTVFHPDAELVVFRPGDGDLPSSQRSGHDELAGIPPALGRYDSTDHRVLGGTYRTGADGEAVGEVRCEAHHVTRTDDGAHDDVMTVRYDDVYRPDADGVWRIVRRRVTIERIDRHDLGGAS